jgi:hypothetical protein
MHSLRIKSRIEGGAFVWVLQKPALTWIANMSKSKLPGRPGVLSREEAWEIIAPHFSRLETCFHLAWKDWKAIRESVRCNLKTRARACIIHDRATYHARHLFTEVPEVRCAEHRGFLTIHIQERAEIRLKKLDAKLRSSNILTLFQKLYGMQFPLFGEDVFTTRLTAGYQMDKMNAEMERVVVTCQDGVNVLYFFDGNDGDAALFRRIEQSAQVSNDQPAPRVRAKKTKKASEQ